MASAAASNPCFMATETPQGTYLVPLVGQSLAASGTFDFVSGSLSVTATVAGSISITGAMLNEGGYIGQVNSGAMTASVAGFGVATLNVVADAANVIEIAPGERARSRFSSR